jgi:hypothetical protein
MVESCLKENIQDNIISQEEHLDPEPSYKIKPRALIFKANQKDLDKIKGLIEKQFPEVKILYITTGPATSILHITKSMPSETQNYPTPTFYTIE